MPKPFDDTTRFLLTLGADAWPNLLGLKAGTVEIHNTDLSTVTSQADVVLLLDKRVALHIENQTSYDSEMGERMLLYRALARRSLNIPVLSYVFLLCPQADGPAMNGSLRELYSDGSLSLEFNFHVVRIWHLPPEKLFDCGLGVLPLAFISDITQDELPDLVNRTKLRLEAQVDPRATREIWTAIDILLGLKYDAGFVKNLLKGVQTMKESTTYQAILQEGDVRGHSRGRAEGRLDGARQILIDLGSERFGAPDAATLVLINAAAFEKIEQLIKRSHAVLSWNELFETK